MPYYHARSNVCRSGVTHAGLVNHPMELTVGGTTRKGDTLQNVKYTVTIPLDGGPSTCTFRVSGTKPVLGQDVVFSFGGESWWAGSVLRVRAYVVGQLVMYDVQAIDWTWLMNRYLPVNGEYAGMGINTAVRRILEAFTDGGFRGGYLPASLGDVEAIVFEDVPVVDALQRLAKMANAGVGAYLRIKPDKSVDIGTTFPDGISLAWVNASNYRDLAWEETLDQVRTRTYARGRGSAVVTRVGPGTTTVDVEDCASFSASGGSAHAGHDTFTYTGKSVASGPGQLTGVSGVESDLEQGELVRVSTQVDDSAAQTALATVLGGGRSGVVSNVLDDEAWTLAEAVARATADVQFNKAAAQAVSYTVTAKSAVVRNHAPGQVVAASVTAPLTISGNFVIQSVTIVPFDTQAATDDPFLTGYVSAGTVSRTGLVDLLVRARG